MPAEPTLRIDTTLVQRLIAEQFPRWRDLPVRPVERSGWDNRSFRLGDTLVARLPSSAEYADKVAIEQHWLPSLAPMLPQAIPEPVALGEPCAAYPWPWSIRRWIDGVDAAAACRLWEAALAACWTGPALWLHGDVAAGNLLLRDGTLCAVIDFGGMAVGDPACDLAIAWTLFDPASRQVFRDTLGADDGMWVRGRGWALWKALIVLAGCPGTDPQQIPSSRQVLEVMLSDF